ARDCRVLEQKLASQAGRERVIREHPGRNIVLCSGRRSTVRAPTTKTFVGEELSRVHKLFLGRSASSYDVVSGPGQGAWYRRACLSPPVSLHQSTRPPRI